ncbi:MAG TPA: MlaD family protein [Baekduia sp.]|nr:MlaD family protein [Baekduia sp.]
MRRALALGAVLAAAGGLGLAATGGAQQDTQDGPSSGEYRVDAVFDTAKGIVPGQLVKIAGARVGEVADVQLTPQYTARLELAVDGRFAPFRADARCEIQPEGLISENFVQCDPGSPDAPPLQAGGEGTPTVPLDRTRVPVNLTDLFEIWKAPVRDRLQIVLTALGAGVAARGEDLNALLRRANPTLGLVREAVGIVDAQRDEVAATLRDAHRVTAELARRPDRVEAFIDATADVTERTARRRSKLQEGVRRLPGLLQATRPALQRLERFADDSTPVVRDLRAASPDLERLLRRLPAAGREGLPALRALGTTGHRARPTIRSARPVVRRLATFAGAARPTGKELATLLVNLRERGFVESLLRFVFNVTRATSRYDAVSHILPAHMVLSTCSLYATAPAAGCDANYTRTAPAARHGQRRAPSARRPRPEQPPAALPTPAPRPAPRPGTAPGLPQVTRPVTELVDRLVGALTGPRRDGRGTDRLLDLLLGP